MARRVDRGMVSAAHRSRPDEYLMRDLANHPPTPTAEGSARILDAGNRLCFRRFL
jgi:hypothetical protein